MKTVCVVALWLISNFTLCNGRATPFLYPLEEIQVLQIDVQAMENEISSTGQEDRVPIIVAEQLLSALDDVFVEKYKGSVVDDPTALAGDGLKLGLFAFMGYHGKEDCMARCACEAGDLLGRMSDTSSLALTALQYMAPKRWNDLVVAAKKGVVGNLCVSYRCGPQLVSVAAN